MNRLIILSNRVADLRKSSQSGGLAVGLADALKERGGVWFGWNGKKLPARADVADVEEIGKVQMISAPMTSEDYAQFYVGYANSVLWPLFHYRLDLVNFQPAFYKGYDRVNAYFAKLIVPHLRSDDLIWVHDYHFIPMAHHLRKLGCRQRIGFFLHIPFPPPDLLAASPNHRKLVENLLSHDVIGFQTQADVNNFRHYLTEWEIGESVDDDHISVDGRTITLKRYPIGIDVQSVRDMAAMTPEDVAIDTSRRNVLRRRQIIGVDRLDYSKGLPERFQAFERLLTARPELEKHVTFLQVAPPTREDVDAYADIRAELEGLAGRINGRFSDFNWIPLRYIHRSVAREKLAALYRASRVGLVTPLRDGMNLVAKEYVAAQDDADPGVLVLSQFAGAAEEMQEAVIVNPYDIDSMASAIHRGLEMSLEERQERHRALVSRIEEGDAAAWLRAFLRDLDIERAPGDGRIGIVPPPIDASAA
jgi:trehalose 6-phosphate synthase